MLSFSASRYGEPTTFGDFIKKARLEKGLTQVAVARVVGVDEMTVVNWEKADRLPRQYAKLRHLCEQLGLDYARTVDRFGPRPSDEPSFGATLQRARMRKGLTQEEAARKAGIDPGTLGRWERSAIQLPSWLTRKLDNLRLVLMITNETAQHR